MKALLTLSFVLLVSSFSQAAITCQNVWGTKAYLYGSGERVTLEFSRKYPASTLSYNGTSGESVWYRSSRYFAAQISKSVFTSGKGKIYYSYPDQGGRDTRTRTVMFTCH